jgi:hypothetical protein
MGRWSLVLLAALVAIVPCSAPACSLCGSSLQNALTFRQEAGLASARIIFYGTVEKSDPIRGVSEFRIESVVRSDPFLGDKKTVELPRALPILDPKDPPKFLVFCDVFKGKLDPYRGVPVQSADMIKYLKGALALESKDRARSLLYYFDYLEHADKKIAEDAFLEFAKSTDQEIGQIASKLSAAKIRGWIKDRETPEYRLGMYAFLLGACGGAEDAAALRAMLQKPSEKTMTAFDGILGGYIQLRPEEGWTLALDLLRDSSKDFQIRFAVVRTLRFYHGWKPEECKARVLRGLAAVLPQGDIADLAVEDLRRWQMWDLTDDVLALYGKKSHDAPLMRRAIVRYAMSCPKPKAKDFVAQRRRDEPDLVRDVEESLQSEVIPKTKDG